MRDNINATQPALGVWDLHFVPGHLWLFGNNKLKHIILDILMTGPSTWMMGEKKVFLQVAEKALCSVWGKVPTANLHLRGCNCFSGGWAIAKQGSTKCQAKSLMPFLLHVLLLNWTFHMGKALRSVINSTGVQLCVSPQEVVPGSWLEWLKEVDLFTPEKRRQCYLSLPRGRV